MYSRKIKKTRRLTGKAQKKQIYRGEGLKQRGQSLLKDGVVKWEGGRRQGKERVRAEHVPGGTTESGET